MTFTVLIGNADAHGKNVSLLHTKPGRVALAPLYDTVPTALWPKLSTRAAMTINSREELDAVTLHDVAEEARSWTIQPRSAESVARETAESLHAACDEIAVPLELRALIQERAAKFLQVS